jgi:hypothetical protein
LDINDDAVEDMPLIDDDNDRGEMFGDNGDGNGDERLVDSFSSLDFMLILMLLLVLLMMLPLPSMDGT